jgi:hypothetical protein
MNRIFVPLATSLLGALAFYGCGGGGNGGASTDAGSDASTADAPPHHEASGPYDSSSGGGDSTSSTCPTPVDTSSWQPPTYKQAKHDLSACTAQNLADFDKNCLNASTKSTANCNAYKTSDATCYGCLVSQSTDATWGPLYVDNGAYQANIGGCLELTDPSSTTCDSAQEAAELCAHAACDSVCPVTDQTSFTAWQQCAQTADTDACGQYVTAANNCLSSETAAAAQACIPTQNSTFESLFLGMAPIFCGGGGDAGAGDGGTTDAASEAGGDAAGD